MKTVIFVSPHVNLYGAERSMLSYMKFLSSVGIQPFLIIPSNGPITETLNKENIPYIVERYFFWINETPGVKSIIKYYSNYYIAMKIKRKLIERGYNPDLVHTNSVITPFGVQLSEVLKVPHIQHIREFGSLDFDMHFNFDDKFLRKVLNKSEKVICISKAVKKHYQSLIKSDKLITVYNGIDGQESKGVPVSLTWNILLVGRLSEEKGQEHVLSAIELLVQKGYSNIQLHLYGNGKNQDTLEKVIIEKKLSGFVKLMGFRTDINYADYKVGIMSSKNEAFGRVTIEYMLNGLPVIGTNSGGTSEIVVPGETGYTYQFGDSQTLASYLEDLYLNQKLIQILGANGKQRAKDVFGESAYCHKVYEVYQSFI